MGITKSFEQKFLLGWGRHLWNIVGVSGFIAVLTGIILFGNSTLIETAKSKERFLGKDELITDEMVKESAKAIKIEREEAISKEMGNGASLLSMKEWIDLKDKVVPLLSVKEWSDKYSRPYPFSSDGKRLINKDVLYEYTKYREEKYQEYKVLKSSPLLKKQKEQELNYRNYLNQVRDRNSIKRSHGYVSPFVVGYGLAVIASASISSALLSIERNTRKD